MDPVSEVLELVALVLVVVAAATLLRRYLSWRSRKNAGALFVPGVDAGPIDLSHHHPPGGGEHHGGCDGGHWGDAGGHH